MHHRGDATDNLESTATTAFARVIWRARQHDEEALVTLYQHALPVIYRYVLARLGRPDLVEDVVSEVFLTMVESIGDLRAEQEAGFYAWLLQIAQGKISRALRHAQRAERRHVSALDARTTEGYPAIEPAARDLGSNPVALHEWRETLEEVGAALESLSTEQQVVVVGRFLADQKIEDLAQALGRQPGAVRVLQFRALKTLAQRLGLSRKSRNTGKGERA